MLGATHATLFISLRRSKLGFLRRLFSGFELRTFAVKLLINLDDLGVFWGVQAIFFLLKAHATRLKLRDAFFGIGLFQIRELRVAVNRIE